MVHFLVNTGVRHGFEELGQSKFPTPCQKYRGPYSPANCYSKNIFEYELKIKVKIMGHLFCNVLHDVVLSGGGSGVLLLSL